MSISVKQMRALDQRAIREFEIPSIVLMENAAMGIFRQIKHSSYTIVCGPGNNGGDGLALARHLFLNKRDVEVFIFTEESTDDYNTNLKIVNNLGIKVVKLDEKNLSELEESLEVNEVLIDAIFGTGLSRDIEGIYKDVIELINTCANYKISIDIPSGMDGDSGDEYGACVFANETFAISDIKDGLLLNSKSGKIHEIYIGIPKF